MDCVFCKIIAGELPATLQYQDENIIAFKDIHPQAPTHTLIVPRRHFNTLNDVPSEDIPLLGQMLFTAQTLAKKFNISESGYRLIFNCNAGGGQSVFHIHAHLLAGKTMSAERLV